MMSDNEIALDDLHEWAALYESLHLVGRSYKIEVSHHENDIGYTVELWSCDNCDVATVVYGYGDTLTHAAEAALGNEVVT
jgi:hypothetical protein